MNSCTSLVQTLAVQSQLNLPGTAGRLLKQIRDLEKIAPRFVTAGLVQPVDVPPSLNLRLSGIATRFAVTRLAGGFLFASAALRMDLRFERNALATEGTDSTSLIDDIDFVDQSKRLQLTEIRQAYELADHALRMDQPPRLLLFEGPLVLNRSMAPLGKASQHVREYERAVDTIRSFWKEHTTRLFPWDPQGCIVAGIATERLGAIVSISQGDLRTVEGQKALLPCDLPDIRVLGDLSQHLSSISGIGDKRFVRGILGASSRTAAFKMNVQTPRMEPADIVDKEGVIGFHYRGGTRDEPLLVQLLGNERAWTKQGLNEVAGLLIAATVGEVPVPFQLAHHQLAGLPRFLQQYCRTMKEELKSREIEDSWLADLES